MSVVAGRRKSGKGQKCPSCGAITFQQYGQVFRCSACDARGRDEKAPPRLASEKGEWCHLCEEHTLRRIYDRIRGNERLTIYTCQKCGSVIWTRADAT